MTSNVPNLTTPVEKSEFEIAAEKLLGRTTYADGKISLDLGTYPLEDGEGATLYRILKNAKGGLDITKHQREYLVTTLRQYSSYLVNISGLPRSPIRDASPIQDAINTICITLTQIDPLTVISVDAFELY